MPHLISSVKETSFKLRQGTAPLGLKLQLNPVLCYHSDYYENESDVPFQAVLTFGSHVYVCMHHLNQSCMQISHERRMVMYSFKKLFRFFFFFLNHQVTIDPPSG